MLWRRSITNKLITTKNHKGSVGPDPTSLELINFASVCPEFYFNIKYEKAKLSFCSNSDAVPNYSSGCWREGDKCDCAASSTFEVCRQVSFKSVGGDRGVWKTEKIPISSKSSWLEVKETWVRKEAGNTEKGRPGGCLGDQKEGLVSRKLGFAGHGLVTSGPWRIWILSCLKGSSLLQLIREFVSWDFAQEGH